jgi:hypothetical protein
MDRPDKSSDESRGQSSPSWAGVLVLYCLAAGLMAAMLEMERSQYAAERDHARLTATSYALAEARQEDLGRNLSDGQTRIIHLTATEPRFLAGALALNESLHWGALFCDGLGPRDMGQPFKIWSIGAGGAATQLSEIRPAPGVSVYPFEWASDVSPIQRVEITAGSGAAGAAAIFSGSLQ